MINYILLNVFIVLIIVYYFYKLKHGIHMLQLESYFNDRYKVWMSKNKKEKLIFRDLLLLTPVIITIFNVLAGLIAGICIISLLYFSRPIYKIKKPLAYTKRVKRLFITGGVTMLIPAVLSNVFINNYGLPISLFVVSLIAILSTYMVLVINKLNTPIEKYINNKFIKKAKKKLNDYKDLKIVLQEAMVKQQQST